MSSIFLAADSKTMAQALVSSRNSAALCRAIVWQAQDATEVPLDLAVMQAVLAGGALQARGFGGERLADWRVGESRVCLEKYPHLLYIALE